MQNAPNFVAETGDDDLIHRLPRREREIAEIVYAKGEASAEDVCRALSDPLSNAAVRTMLQRIEAKGMIRRRRDGKRYLYSAALPDRIAREAALQRVSRDYFDGSLACTALALTEMLDRESASAAPRGGLWGRMSPLDDAAHP